MSTFVAITFQQMEMLLLQSALDELKKQPHDKTFKLYSSVVVARDRCGKLSVQQLTAEGLSTTAVGAMITAGLPLGPVAGMIGAAGSALIGNSNEQANEHESQFVEKISRGLKPGEAMIVAELDEDGVAAFEAAMKRIGGSVICKEQNQIARAGQ